MAQAFAEGARRTLPHLWHLALVQAARHADLRLAGAGVLAEQAKNAADVTVAQGGGALR
jgi:hypothetical protein